MLEKSSCLLFNELGNHVAEDSADRIESLVRGADVIQPMVIKKDLLYDEDRDRLAELRASFHNSKAQRNDLRGEEEVYDIGGIILHESSDDTERGESKIFEGSRLRRGIEEWI